MSGQRGPSAATLPCHRRGGSTIVSDPPQFTTLALPQRDNSSLSLTQPALQAYHLHDSNNGMGERKRGGKTEKNAYSCKRWPPCISSSCHSPLCGVSCCISNIPAAFQSLGGNPVFQDDGYPRNPRIN
ncbi:hypothetical protein E2C01_018897 [Portunus trituberculatus]|uniref:Uncharacterized protein n=1 Tax=Portunus trituberculatus TaxID=210409 RepID=A0A5B7DWV1_PORTR|nr:hypothetical protein [Portunus trituberculatus]